jgi:Spy/CpxP family protein refolding chaperone
MLLLAALTVPASADPGPVAERISETLDRIDATPDQRSAIRERVESARATLQGFRTEAQELREQIHAALFGETVDRAALEEDRLELVDLFDRATATAFDLFADVSEVLTPEQRAELHRIRDQGLAERIAQWRGQE